MTDTASRSPPAGPAGSEPLLDVLGLGRILPNGWIWRDIDLRLEPGDRAMLVGASGTGKSLLLRTLCGLDRATEGWVCFRGARTSELPPPIFRSQVLYVQQSPVLTPGTVADNVDAPRAFRVHRHRKPALERARTLFQRLGKPAVFPDQRSSLLSGGEAQLVGLVRALTLDPAVLLLDEPTAHLDPDTTEAVEDLIREWAAEGERAVLWTSHDPLQVRRVRSGPLLTLGEGP